MVPIQTIGSEILSNNPKSFYIFGGVEYGIKFKYMKQLEAHYGAKVETTSASDILNLMKQKRLLPLPPKLYVVRYDTDFISSLSDKTAEMISKINISGTIVCLYEDPKHLTKCNKYLPNCTTEFTNINPKFIEKYLISDYPQLPQSAIHTITSILHDYMSCYYICNSLSMLNLSEDEITSEYIISNFVNNYVGRNKFRYSFAARDIRSCLSILDHGDIDYNYAYITMLSTLLDIEKLLCKYNSKSDLSRYAKCWDAKDIYHMFLNVESELEKSRNFSEYDLYNGLVYLLGLLIFRPIPKVGA